MTIVAHTHPYVVGVDTHAGTHTYAIRRAATGEQLGVDTFPATAAGMARAGDWAGRRTGGDAGTLWVIEGVGSYGAGLARAVRTAGYQVVEAPRMDPRARRGVGKSDPLDAAAIAAAVLPVEIDQLREPRADDGIRAALRVLVTARDQMTTEKTAYSNALTALVRTTLLGIDARKALTITQVREIAHWRAREETIDLASARAEAGRLARRIEALKTELRANEKQMVVLLKSSPAAPLLDETGVGPVTAAVVLCAWSHPGRVRSAAAFTSLAGVNPIPASSGNTTHDRLNRGGDRRLNRALHMAVITRMTHDPDSKTYLERRTKENPKSKSKRDVRRCLKRYLARHLYRRLNALYAEPNPT